MDISNISVEEAMELAKRFAPIVYLDSKEKYFPCDVSWYIDLVDLYYDGKKAVINRNLKVTDLAGSFKFNDSQLYLGYDSKFELRIRDDQTRYGQSVPNGKGPQCYVNIRNVQDAVGVRDDMLDIQYWFFYAYNYPLFRGDLNNYDNANKFIVDFFADLAADLGVTSSDEHEADWEHVTVRVSRISEELVKNENHIESVFYAKHGLDNQWMKPVLKDGRPVVYSAKFSHASYSIEGLIPDEAVKEKAGEFISEFVLDETNMGHLWDVSQNLVMLYWDPAEDWENPWNMFAGKWGKDGPESPGRKRSWFFEDMPQRLADNCWSDPFLDGDYLYFQGGETGKETLCRVRKDGTGWVEEIDNNCGSTPFVTGDYVYFQGGDNRDALYRRLKNGNGGATFLDSECGNSPFVNGNYVYYAGGDNRNSLHRILINGTGKTEKLDNNCGGRPFVSGDYVYFQGGGKRNALYRRLKDGSGDAKKIDNNCGSNPYVSDNGNVYFQGGGSRNNLYSCKADGSDSAEQMDPQCKSGPFRSDGYVYFEGNDGLYRIDEYTQKGKPVAQQLDSNGRGTPVQSDNYMYYRGNDNRLYCMWGL